MILSKTLSEYDYFKFEPYTQFIDNNWKTPGREEHPHRHWEYALTLKALVESNTHTVLDVGGGASRLAPIFMRYGLDVLQVDPADNGWLLAKQEVDLGQPIPYVKQDFMAWDDGSLYDAVTCISVLEHVPDDHAFFRKLCKHVGPYGILVITVDFSPDGKQKSGGHLRTYNEETLLDLVYDTGNEWLELEASYDYTWDQPHVFDYTFASAVLSRP